MNSSKLNLPHNPYLRSPIRNINALAGRDTEQKAIRYYLNLTASGQSPHLALIGRRGVGKTSLLNVSECICNELGLLPVRLDLNELKSQSPGRFWHDLYQSLALSMVAKGCWGGIQGKIYASLLQMMHSRQPGNIEDAVLQIPYLFSCCTEGIDLFECPDALVVNDFKICLAELKRHGFHGFVVLIDEADCLGRNVPLLQMFRNIFQAATNCSLVLAGTEAVFPSLSDVFSPIPRQFYKLDILPFRSWVDTRDLMRAPLSREVFEQVAPELDVLIDLHDLCGGSPDEVQLYCHHMYRNVESGASRLMELSPQVFREVLREYRANTPANVEKVLNAIEKLPDQLLFKSRWLSRRMLTLEENIEASILRSSLKLERPLTEIEKLETRQAITRGCQTLFELGISMQPDRIDIAGAPLTSGFWKSFVNFEKGTSWSWDDNSFNDILFESISQKIGHKAQVGGFGEQVSGKDANNALQGIRNGEKCAEFDTGMTEMLRSALFAKKHDISHAADISLQITSTGGRYTSHFRFFENPKIFLKRESFEEILTVLQPVLAASQIEAKLLEFERWTLPSSDELHRLGRISGYRIRDVFGATEFERAIGFFNQGDLNSCISLFSRMVADREDSEIRNNLAFCQILAGDINGALSNVELALAVDSEPLYELNRGIALYFLGRKEDAIATLHFALDQLSRLDPSHDTDLTHALVLNVDTETVGYAEGMTVGAAVLLNLSRIGAIGPEELKEELHRRYPADANNWLNEYMK